MPQPTIHVRPEGGRVAIISAVLAFFWKWLQAAKFVHFLILLQSYALFRIYETGAHQKFGAPRVKEYY